MTLKPNPAHITWTLYLKSGPIEIWEGRPNHGNYSQWECRNIQSGEIRHIDQNSALLTFEQMLTNINS